MQVEIVLTPAEVSRLTVRDLRQATCVVFDVLRATSTILTALANGAKRILPAATVEEARTLWRSRDPGTLLGGERGGVKLEGFDLGNSPLEYSPDTVMGREIVMTTTNGTLALRACGNASIVYAAALLNLEAQAAAIQRQQPPPETVFLVCAGTGDAFAAEDGLAAAALLARLAPIGPPDDAAMLLDALHRVTGERVLEVLKSSQNGRRLQSIGLAADIVYCSRQSVLDTVALLRDGGLERLRSDE